MADEETIEQPQDNNPEAILAWERRIRRKAKELVKSLEHGYMDLARVLYYVFDKPHGGKPHGDPLYKAWGFKSFAEYVDKELNFGVRKAQRLRYIWYRLEVELVDLDPALKKRVVAMGWSKARELVRMLSHSNAEEWVPKAESLSFVELEEEVRDYLEKIQTARDQEEDAGGERKEVEPGVPDVETPRAFGAQLFKDQKKVVDAAFDRAAELAGVQSRFDKKGHLLTLICTDFLATNHFLTGGFDDKLRYLAKIEEGMGLKIMAADAEGRELVYGQETLEKMVAAYEETEEPELPDNVHKLPVGGAA